MKHAFDSKGKAKVNSSVADFQTNWREHRFANSAYRSAKQRGFFTVEDVFKSIETDEEFRDQMNLHEFLRVAKHR